MLLLSWNNSTVLRNVEKQRMIRLMLSNIRVIVMDSNKCLIWKLIFQTLKHYIETYGIEQLSVLVSLQVILRKDDIKLLRRFLDLHATMMELKWVYESANSVSDVSSYNGSNMSLDDVMNAPRNCCLTSDEQDTQFRERTTSLLIPRKSRVTRIRWKSNEIIWSIIISLSQTLLEPIGLFLKPSKGAKWILQLMQNPLCNNTRQKVMCIYMT